MRTLTNAQIIALQEAIAEDMAAYLGYSVVIEEVSHKPGERVTFTMLGLTEADKNNEVVDAEFMASYERAMRALPRAGAN
jgi:hypothetical protein